jgi:hypothetical protein
MAKVSISKNKDNNPLFLPDAEFLLLAEQYIKTFHPHSNKNNPNASSLPIPAIAYTKFAVISVISPPSKLKLKERIQADLKKLSRVNFPSTALLYISSSSIYLSKKEISKINNSAQLGYIIAVIDPNTIYDELLNSNQTPVTMDENILSEYYNTLFSTPDILSNILDKIFNFVNNKYAHLITLESFDTALIHLRKKIEINFTSSVHSETLNLYDIYWQDKSIVEKFIRTNFELYESQLYTVLYTIRTGFQNSKSNQPNSIHSAVQEPLLFKELSNLLIEQKYLNDPRYQKVALALVLFFFEYCDFGKKSPDDPETLFSKYDRDYDSSN